VTDDVNEQTPDLNTHGAALTSHQPPPAKIQKRDSDSVLYGSYDRRRKSDHSDLTTAALVKKYLDFVKSLNADAAEPWAAVRHNKTFERLLPLFERVFCSPATSAPVERVFSHGGLFMRPHRASLSDKMLANLVMLKCNKHIKI
jgi:hAT family C-terminal dimerisation region